MVRPNQKLDDYEPEPRYDLTILQFGSAGVQMGVMEGVLLLYNRHIDVEVMHGRKYMSLVDFFNQLIVRGIIDHDKQLRPIETEMDKVFGDAVRQMRKNDAR